MTSHELFRLVRTIVLNVTGVPEAIKASQGAPSPSGEYATIKTTTGRRQHGQSIIRRTNAALASSPIGPVHDVNQDVRPQIVAQAIVNFYRGNAHDYAESLLGANKRADISALLFQAGVGWQRVDGPTDLTALQSNEFEPRAQLTLHLMYEQSYSETINSIYSVEITTEDEDANTLNTTEVN
tara:strand:- start:167 stop:712 length:546 start_codon:yes stop_codon:yes gene_type:complete